MYTTRKRWPRRRVAAAVVALALMAAMLLGGSYAWLEWVKGRKDTSAGLVNNQVVLHDDFGGTNKDVYVENTGDSIVFVRVKFTEYLQIGNNPVLDAAAEEDNKTTWTVHQWTDANTTLNAGTATATGALVGNTAYYTWTLGDADTAQKTFLSGVTTSDWNGQGGLSTDDFNTYKVGDAVPLSASLTATKKQTAAASAPMWMAEYNIAWIQYWGAVNACADAANHTEGKLCTTCEMFGAEADETNYYYAIAHTVTTARWLLDTDGWAYWSKPLYAGEATNLLLDAVAPGASAPQDNWAYNIDVQMQAISASQISGWIRDNSTDTAQNAVASADNSKMTAATAGTTFIANIANEAKFRTGELIRYKDTVYVMRSSNLYVPQTANTFGVYEDDTQKMEDGLSIFALGTDAENMLAGRAYNDAPATISTLSTTSTTTTSTAHVGIAAAGVYAEGYGPLKAVVQEAYYTIEGADTSYYVVAGADGQLGTWDDVIRDGKTTTNDVTGTTSLVGRLGIYNYSDDTSNVTSTVNDEAKCLNGTSVGWHYMSGTVDNMLLLCESIAGKSQFSQGVKTTESWNYNWTSSTAGYSLKSTLQTFYNDLNGTKTAIQTNQTITITDPYQDGERYYGVKVCNISDHWTIGTAADGTVDSAYHNSDVNSNGFHCITYRASQYAYRARENFAAVTVSGFSAFFAPSMQEIVKAYNTAKDGEAVALDLPKRKGSTQTVMWLRTPGFATTKGTTAAYNSDTTKGYLDTGYVKETGTATNPGDAVAACYANLA